VYYKDKGLRLGTKIVGMRFYSVSFGFVLSEFKYGVRVLSIELMTDTKYRVSHIVYCVCVCVCMCVCICVWCIPVLGVTVRLC
jgi:hypothetical protein